MAGMDGGVIRAPNCPHYAARPHRATLSLTACDVLLPPPPLLPLYFSLMPARYAPLPNPHTDPDAINEMEAAFDDSDDDDDGPQPPTARGRNGYQALSNAEPEHPTRDSHDVGHHQGAAAPGAYDFENADFDYIRPPPGSPPGPSARALPNEFGNSNGLVPAFQESATDAAPSSSSSRGASGWFRRTAQAVLPTHYVQRLGLADERPQGPVGGGFSNDGVFANVTAKPSRGIRVQDGACVCLG